MAEAKTIRWEQDSDGIVVLTLDDPNQSANTMNNDFRESLKATVERLEAEKDSITGVVLTSAKKTFFAGGELKELIQASPDTAESMAEMVGSMRADMRKLETLGKPVVSAINGAALGGGLELALATHHRIAADVKGSQIGFPEVTLGLLPGGGGVARSVRLLGIQNALLNWLLQGQRHRPAKAVELGLVHELVGSVDELLPKAKEWIKANPEGGVQPWDADGYKIPGGTPSSPKFAANLPAFPANLRKQLKGAPMPAPRAILAAAVEGTQVDFENALKIETQYFISLATGQVSTNMIKAFFFDLNHINNGGSRPDGIEKKLPTKVGVLGAGMMGAGIAYVTAKAGIDVVLKDVSIESANKGKDYSVKIEKKALDRGKTTQEKSDALLARITPTADAKDLDGVDFVVEAVFENTELKHKVFQEIEDVVNPDALLGSNTSTIPITILAEGVKRQEDFIGIHFFSPVDKMPLVEIIRGKNTSDEALARVFDYTLAIKKTPIVVNDSRGFFTSRVIGTFINEALAAVGEGVEPASIEQAGSQAGFPAPPLQLSDELTLTLMQKIRKETKAGVEAAGGSWVTHGSEAVVDKMVDEFERKGRSTGSGFYEYGEDGKRAGLWSGLREAFDAGSGDVPFEDLQERMLFVQAVETVRCFDEGVLNTIEDANIGSIFGIGFPPWTGGVIQYINQYEGGLAGFVARARELAQRYGDHFLPPESLVTKAEKGEVFE
ncbi:3-hydroxyacyl-CoA dehydrogenase/enoyl-CoA hydratase/3-hydroxybutyryl-CoA epimerase [Herbihabitans rhizosphaerae]|uniref:3-hydroxyacyl-CoA dehydrogenase/enoyl-CoA hydratase/3-hydroxybutyryl-CoA epimerase n=1 Tax=Herbihabitans rhizosphaerae TaxID=1872711 RepID=A0A4Q7KGM7_9PSEU|nr:3-hydroxyacyl-CoA dehydrogenase NAD-binding domain-containing protein [Herbihabitans rhizosphaerae]RZS34402.1 3-hydroxyacyl-CoA dehydrogenase/enoyl-CoA hydratase/3-hydroxybutyryl-CoA epimerase [Herbihabitans rhizosphaerae]